MSAAPIPVNGAGKPLPAVAPAPRLKTPSTDVPEAQRMERLRQLLPWVRGTGACGVCSLSFALAQVEREAGDVFPVPPGAEGCARRDHLPTCRELTKRQWAGLPRPTQEAKP